MFKFGFNSDQIEVFVTRSTEWAIWKKLQSDSSRELSTQHRLAVFDINIRRWRKNKEEINNWMMELDKSLTLVKKTDKEDKWQMTKMPIISEWYD